MEIKTFNDFITGLVNIKILFLPSYNTDQEQILSYSEFCSNEENSELIDSCYYFPKKVKDYVVIKIENNQLDIVERVRKSMSTLYGDIEKIRINYEKYNSFLNGDIRELDTEGRQIGEKNPIQVNYTDYNSFMDGIYKFESLLTLNLFDANIFDRRGSYLSNNQTNKSEIKPILFLGNQTQLVELVKAMIETKMFDGKQKDIINSFAMFFGIGDCVPNQDKIIQDMKKRNLGSETLFLNALTENLFKYLNKNTR